MTRNALLYPLCAWGIENKKLLKSLDVDESERLKRLFGCMVDKFVAEAEMEEFLLLEELLEGVDLGIL